MRCRPYVIPVLSILLLAAAAGCLSGPADGSDVDSHLGGTAPPLPPPASAPEANGTAGSVTGLVVDAEGLPLPLVTVTLVETAASQLTDKEGRFTFNDVEPGEYRIVFDRLGYDQAAKRVDVRSGEVTELEVALSPLEIPDEPYYLSLPVKAHIKANWNMITYVMWDIAGLNVSQVNSVFCEPCQFTLFFEPSPVDALSEAWWESGVDAPVVNPDIYLSYYANWTAESEWRAWGGYLNNRQQVFWSATHDVPDELADTSELRLQVHGSLLGVNIDHKPEIWTTFAYNGEFPDGFTMLPPDE